MLSRIFVSMFRAMKQCSFLHLTRAALPPYPPSYKTVPVLLSLLPSLIFPLNVYLPRFILPDFPSTSSQASLPFSSCHRTIKRKRKKKEIAVTETPPGGVSCTQINLFGILLIQTEIRLYLSFTKPNERTSVWSKSIGKW